MINHSLSLLQLCDSNFPNGSFSQSFGLETYIQKDIVHNAESFLKWLEIYLYEQVIHTDGLAARFVYEALEVDDLDTIWEFDRLLLIQNLARESREGTQRMGDAMLQTAIAIYESSLLNTYRKRVQDKKSYGHPAIVFTIAGYHLHVDKETTILYYLYSTMINLVQNAVRAIPLGQTTGQQIIQSFQTKLQEATNIIMKMDKTEFGIVAPGLELSQMQHERVGIRIFSS